MTNRYDVRLSPGARRSLTESLPESVAAAAAEFIHGPLAEQPRRVGKPLTGPLAGKHSARRGEYRIIYTIDDGAVLILVLTIAHRRDAYRR